MDSDAAFVVAGYGDEEKHSFELTNLREARCVRCIHQFKARSYHKQSSLARGNCAQRSARGEIRQKLCTEKGLELELIQTQMAQKPMLRAEVGMRVRCANKASAE